MMVPETYGSNLKIICVTETMFDSDMQTAEINIPNFVPYRKDRLNGKEGGGSCIYVHETIRPLTAVILLQYVLKLIHILLYLFVSIVHSH